MPALIDLLAIDSDKIAAALIEEDAATPFDRAFAHWLRSVDAELSRLSGGEVASARGAGFSDASLRETFRRCDADTAAALAWQNLQE